MKHLLKGTQVYSSGKLRKRDIAITSNTISQMGTSINCFDFDAVYQLDLLSLVPGFADVYIHLQEPGFSYKETITTGTMAAARGPVQGETRITIVNRRIVWQKNTPERSYWKTAQNFTATGLALPMMP